MQDKLIEALQEIIEVASGKCQVAEDDTKGMAWIDKRARAAVRAHDAGTDEGLPTDRRPCPNCGRSDGWHYALGHPPLPVGDCRKIVWMRDKDEMEWWGVRAYNHAEGYWQSNSREESSTVLFWMETPHSPHYPPASHAAESAPQLDAEYPAEPVEDVVSRMLDAWYTDAESHPYDDLQRACMTDALAVAREGYHSLEDVEKAIRKTGERYPCISGGWASFAAQVCSEIAPKPSPEERVTIVRWLHDPSRWIVLRDGWNPGNHDGFKDRKDAERYAAGLRLELAALADRRTK